jgi:hypothetical protein
MRVVAFIIAAWCVTGVPATAQIAEVSFSTALSDPNLDVSLYIRQTGSSDWKLGMASFVLAYDSNAVSFAGELAEGTWDDGTFPASYADQFAGPYHRGAGRSVEVDFTGANGSGVFVSLLPTLLGTLRFTVKTTGLDPAFAWSLPASFVSDDLGVDRTTSITFAGSTVSVDEQPEIPTSFVLDQNYPNPFNPSTEIRYGIPREGQVSLEVYSIVGQRVATLVDGPKQAGYHTVRFDAASFASGVYIYRLVAPGTSLVQKMMLVR